MKKTVAFIGAGNMGSRMVRRLVAADYRVIVCDSNVDTLASFEADGVETTRRPIDCARADVILIMVADGTQIELVTTGPDGLLDGLPRERPPVIAVMSTALPGAVRALQARLGRDRARVIDAPVSGGLFGASEGTLAIMAGGVASDIDEVEDVFRIFGPNLFRCGPLGAGQTAKIVNNIIGVTNMYGAAEAFDIAERNGLDLETLGPILEAGSGRNFFSADAAKARSNFRAWAASEAAFDSLGDIIRKDLSLARHLAGELGLSTPVLDGVANALSETPETTRERWVRLGDGSMEPLSA